MLPNLLPTFNKLSFGTNPNLKDYQDYLTYLKQWLNHILVKTKKKGFILGLSGGIDSSLLSVIVSQAVGYENYLVVTMPIESPPIDLALSEVLIKKFNLSSYHLDLKLVFEAELKCLERHLITLPEAQKRLVVGNIKTRLRTINLYALGQSHDFLIIGTTNYDEWMSGYFAKYGDSACDLSPLRYLLKRDIVTLAKYLGLPNEIIERKPSASLYENQTDEADLGFSYDQFDQVLTNKQKPTSQMVNLFNNSAHKRNPPFVPDLFRELIVDFNSSESQ